MTTCLGAPAMFENCWNTAGSGLTKREESYLLTRTTTNAASQRVLDCLLSFETQDAMLKGNLNRPLALSTISALLDGEEMVAQSTSPVGGDDSTQSASDEANSQPSQEERLERARARRARNRS